MERLVAQVQPYAWGTSDFIAQLQDRIPTGEPEAELWMGAHPKAPSALSDGTTLNDAIAADADTLLGAAVATAFGQLPFLMKVLSAAQPLSIQTHPNAAQAAAGFERENQKGLALDAPTRTYRDANHKPELICALTPFEAKCGFRPLDATRDLADRLGVTLLSERVGDAGRDADVIAEAMSWLLDADDATATEITRTVVDAAGQALVDPGPWRNELEWTGRINALYPDDPGVVVALLLNHFTLAPGEALFLEAGNLHAYLQGSGIEVMANSDNVIRGGLTPKHVDVAELAAVLDHTPIDPPIQRPTGPVHTYACPVPEFSLTRAELDESSVTFDVTGPEIALVTAGTISVTADSGAAIEAAPGQPLWVGANEGSWSAEGTGTIFRTHVEL